MKVAITFPTHRAVLKFISTCTYCGSCRTDDKTPRFYDMEVWFPSRNVFVSTNFDSIDEMIELMNENKVRFSNISKMREG